MLCFEDVYIVYLLGVDQDNIFYAWNMAFDPEYTNFFPSKLLLYELIEDCHQRKHSECSFMRGETEIKPSGPRIFEPITDSI